MAGVSETRIEEYWDWISWALFLLLTVDLLTTLFAVRVVGPGAEANPVMRWLLSQGGIVLAGVNIAAAVVVVGLFNGLMHLLRATPVGLQTPFARLIELWLGLMLAVGLAVFANNLVVIAAGVSLL